MLVGTVGTQFVSTDYFQYRRLTKGGEDWIGFYSMDAFVFILQVWKEKGDVLYHRHPDSVLIKPGLISFMAYILCPALCSWGSSHLKLRVCICDRYFH